MILKKHFSNNFQVEINCGVIVERISNENNPINNGDNYEAEI